MKMLRIGGAAIYLKMHDGETQDDAVDRMLDIVDDAGIKIIGWNEESIEEYSDETD